MGSQHQEHLYNSGARRENGGGRSLDVVSPFGESLIGTVA
jgi:hypothetical protein